VFFRAVAPFRPIGAHVVSACARRYLLQAGIDVARPGSHTLRHTLVQRLADAGFSLKTIRDFVGHRSPASTEIYAKVAVEPLRQVFLGHVDPASTAVYLTITPQLLDEASRRFEVFAEPAWAEAAP
jgi:integrase/recombinase XerD